MKTFFLACLCAVSLASCSGRIDGALRPGGAADVRIAAALEPRISGLIRSLSAIVGNASPSLILDGSAISLSLGASPGVTSVNLVNTGPSAIEGNAAIARVWDILALAETPFIVYQERAGTNPGGSLTVTLNRETVPALVKLLSAEAVDYLTILMAPVILGEEMTKAEYLALVTTTSFLGKPIADEINAARIRVTLDFPGPVTGIRGGEASGTRAVFDIPLADLLVLETPLSWEAVW